MCRRRSSDAASAACCCPAPRRWRAAEGSATLWLTAWLGNARALAFYRSQGYRELGSTIYAFEGERYENRLFAKSLLVPDISRDAA